MDFNQIDQFDIFDLMGLSKLNSDEKKRILLDLNANIWSEFLFTRLDKILTADQLTGVQKMVEEKKEMSQILDHVQTLAPNFYDLFLEYGRGAKVNIIRDQITSVEEELRGFVEEGKEVSDELKTKLKRYEKAKQFLSESKWEDLKKIMTEN